MPRVTPQDWPRALYAGDIPVEDTSHSSVQLFRLFTDYPGGALRIIETRRHSQPGRRLRQAEYSACAIRPVTGGGIRMAAWSWHAARSQWGHAQLERLLIEHAPRVVITIASGIGWLYAAAAARRHGLPLVLIVHDAWPKITRAHSWMATVPRQRFAAEYRRAAQRLCISPYMADALGARHGVDASVIWPAGAERTGDLEPAFSVERFTVAYCGASGREAMPGLVDLSAALARLGGRLVAYGTFADREQRMLRDQGAAIEFPGFVSSGDLRRGLSQADALFVAMTFSPDLADYPVLSFPSKLTEYTGAGRPIIVQAPAQSSAARWALESGGAVVVTEPGAAPLASALERLRYDDGWSATMARNARLAGATFEPASVRAAFRTAVRAAAGESA